MRHSLPAFFTSVGLAAALIAPIAAADINDLGSDYQGASSTTTRLDGEQGVLRILIPIRQSNGKFNGSIGVVPITGKVTSQGKVTFKGNTTVSGSAYSVKGSARLSTSGLVMSGTMSLKIKGPSTNFSDLYLFYIENQDAADASPASPTKHPATP